MKFSGGQANYTGHGTSRKMFRGDVPLAPAISYISTGNSYKYLVKPKYNACEKKARRKEQAGV